MKSGLDVPLETHSDKYRLEGKGPYLYWQAYFKTGVMLYNLQYVLGEDLHRRAMAHYFEKWKFCHPQRHDFYEAITEYTKWDLRWFFDQWMKKTRTIDYAIEKFAAARQGDGWIAKIKIKRKGTAVMPLDLQFTLADGSTQMALVPVGYQTKSEGNPIVLPKWTGWGNFNDAYEAVVDLPQKPVALESDPSHRLADVYQLDNYASKLPRLQFGKAWKYRHWEADKYKVTWRPKLGYNNTDGLQPGILFKGGYLNGSGLGDRQIDLRIDLGGKLPSAPVSYEFSFMQPLDRLQREGFLTLSSAQRLGYREHEIIFSQIISGHQWGRQTVTALDLALNSTTVFDLKYLNAPQFFDKTATAGANAQYIFRATLGRRYYFGHNLHQRGRVNLRYSSALPGSDHLYNKIELEAKNDLKFHFLKLRTRLAAAYVSANAPVHSLLFASMGSPIDWLHEGWLSARGALPNTWARDGRLQAGGGGNLRAVHANRMAGAPKADNVLLFAGNRLGAFNAELELWNPLHKVFAALPGINSLLKFQPYAFFDLASVQFESKDSRFTLPEPVYDGGIGVMWQPRFRNGLRGIFGRMTEFRFDFPFYLSDPMAGENNLEWRWLVGVGRAF